MSKKVIRRNCFQTNSSSEHSFCITDEDVYVTAEELCSYKYEDKNYNEETLYLFDNKLSLYNVQYGFGRGPFKILYTFKKKLQYAMCEYLGDSYFDTEEDNKMYEELLSYVREFDPDIVDFSLPLRDVDIYLDKEGNRISRDELIYEGYDNEKKEWIYNYKDNDGNIYPAIIDKENYDEIPEIACIDHQSMGLLRGFLRNKGITLKEFLTNKKYIIVIDGDEENVFFYMMKHKLINMDYIKEIYPKRK